MVRAESDLWRDFGWWSSGGPILFKSREKSTGGPFQWKLIAWGLLIHLCLQFGCFKESYLLTQVQPFGPPFIVVLKSFQQYWNLDPEINDRMNLQGDNE